MSDKKLKVTLCRSTIAIHPKHKKCVKGLGLRRQRQQVLVENTPCNWGMIKKVEYLLSVEEA